MWKPLTPVIAAVCMADRG